MITSVAEESFVVVDKADLEAVASAQTQTKKKNERKERNM